jgi:hypothetical protein
MEKSDIRNFFKTMKTAEELWRNIFQRFTGTDMPSWGMMQYIEFANAISELQQSYEARIAELSAKQDGSWISVEERLPDNDFFKYFNNLNKQ